MITEFIKITLDIFILLALGGFMIYALRLSRALEIFRQSRAEFDSILKDLNDHINRAERSLKDLRQASTASGDDLYKMIQDAESLKNDLQIINTTSNKLAARLEDAIDTGGKTKGKKAPKDEGFAIQDPDFEANSTESEALKKLPSAAEKELYQALKKKVKS